MPAQSPEPGEPLNLAERKQVLALNCAADRAAWTRACHSNQRRAPAIAGRVLGWAETIGAFLPGRLGRWVRSAAIVGSMVRNVGLSWF